LNFLENVFEQLKRSAGRPVLQEIRGKQIASMTGAELLAHIGTARSFFHKVGFRKGDRCALLAHNSVRWVAADLALMAEGIIVVPLYARQAVAELIAMMKDCTPRLICCGETSLGESIARAWRDAPRFVSFDEIFADPGVVHAQRRPVASQVPVSREPNDLVAIIYTSGTSGEPKGVCLTVANLDHMLACTTQRLDELMGPASQPDRVFHYLPLNFAASWIFTLSCLSRRSLLSLSTDLNKLADEVRLAAPHYFLNVPTLLERVRRGVEDNLRSRGGFALRIFEKAWQGFLRHSSGRHQLSDAFYRAVAGLLIFPKIRARFGTHLRALICGSAPLARDTQLFFNMLGIRVLQGYGLTETTGICTLDDPRGPVEPGCVGPSIPGVEMVLGENQEILVRGANLFPGYWNRPEETARVLRDGWFHTGDQGEVNAAGNWRIIGRIKNLIILNSGHNIAPEPIEEKLLNLLPGAQHVVLVGNGRGYITALITGDVAEAPVSAALDTVNRDLPHYKQVRAFHLLHEPLTTENGLVTVNGKLKRDAIAARFASEIEAMYQRKTR
jgi:long-chain acyl-CoA synthetase